MDEDREILLSDESDQHPDQVGHMEPLAVGG